MRSLLYAASSGPAALTELYVDPYMSRALGKEKFSTYYNISWCADYALGTRGVCLHQVMLALHCLGLCYMAYMQDMVW